MGLRYYQIVDTTGEGEKKADGIGQVMVVGLLLGSWRDSSSPRSAPADISLWWEGRKSKRSIVAHETIDGLKQILLAVISLAKIADMTWLNVAKRGGIPRLGNVANIKVIRIKIERTVSGG